jgi:hypothetical protein
MTEGAIVTMLRQFLPLTGCPFTAGPYLNALGR